MSRCYYFIVIMFVINYLCNVPTFVMGRPDRSDEQEKDVFYAGYPHFALYERPKVAPKEAEEITEELQPATGSQGDVQPRILNIPVEDLFWNTLQLINPLKYLG